MMYPAHQLINESYCCKQLQGPDCDRQCFLTRSRLLNRLQVCNHVKVLQHFCRPSLPCLLMQVWAVPPKKMQCEWLGERVATVDITRAISNVINNKEDAGWGPNAVFRLVLSNPLCRQEFPVACIPIAACSVCPSQPQSVVNPKLRIPRKAWSQLIKEA